MINNWHQYVPPNSTDVAIGPTAGKQGDLLYSITLVPLAIPAKKVELQDGTLPKMTILPGTGAGFIGFMSETRAITTIRKTRSKNGPWKVSTGNDVAVWVTGNFS